MSRRPATRPRGRPALDANGAPSAELCLNLTVGDYDRLDAIARAARVNVQAIIRRAIASYLHDDPPPESPPRARSGRGSVTIARRLGV